MQKGKCILDEGIYNGFGELIESIYANFDTNLDFILVRIIVNDGLFEDLNGESDVTELIELQNAYNRLTSDDVALLNLICFLKQ